VARRSRRAPDRYDAAATALPEAEADGGAARASGRGPREATAHLGLPRVFLKKG
ncbi:hypothetical protein EVAR_40516_1, partial [Eumeta japonica]